VSDPGTEGGPRNAGQAFAAVVVDELVRHGVTHVVLAPGSRSTPLALALAADPRLRLHVRIDERSASYLAVGLARATGRPVPILCTSGTAAAHFHGAVLEADQSRLPLLVLTADRPPELRGVGANQTIDQVGLYGNAVRWSCDVGVPESRPDAVRYWRSLVSRAVAVATGIPGPAGPVHLNLPLREPLVDVDDGIGFPHPLDGRADGDPWTGAERVGTTAPQSLSGRLARSRRGVVLAGDGLADDDVAGLLALAQRADWPVVAEPHSNARRGRLAVRCAEALLRDERFVAQHEPDLVLVAGRVGLSRVLLEWLAKQRYVVVDRDGSWVDANRNAESVHRCDPGRLGDLPVASAGDDWAAGWLDAGARAAQAVDNTLDAEPSVTEPYLARELAATVPSGGALVVASSMPIRDLDLVMAPRDGLRVIANRGVSGIDGFISTAVGVALGHDGPAYALAGDLSLLHDANGLATGGDDVDLTLVVVNNDGGGIFSLLPQAAVIDTDRFERLFGTPHGVDLAELAAAYGVSHQRVTSKAEFADAIAKRPDGLRIVEVPTERSANAAFHGRLRSAVAAALEP
jgi:2-succinyl-5-enolpyruvyl-6-hydroxy-3-cyclohexene-1-carboxylate synthase